MLGLIRRKVSGPESHFEPKGSTFRCCGVDIDALSPLAAVAQLAELAASGDGHAVHLCNAYTLSLAARDEEYQCVLRSGSLRLPDGAPVAWIGRMRGAAVWGPVRGPDLMLETMRSTALVGSRHFLLGASEQTLDALYRKLPLLAPGLIISGYSPPFQPLRDFRPESLVDRLTGASPDYIWVGLGTPKQDHIASEVSRLMPGVFVAVGAAFDFAAGSKREAPKWLRGSGLEWVFRFVSEPRRLWRRYTIGSVCFLFGVLKEMKWQKCRC